MDKSGAWVRLLLSTLKQEGCSKSAALVLAVIADKATERESRSVWMKQKEVAELAGVDPRTVRRALQQLQALGLIEVQHIPGERCRYRITEQVELPLKKDAAARAAAAARTAAARTAQAKRREEDAAYEAECMALVNRFKEDKL